MTRPPDMLRFIGGVVKRHEVGWDGPWPPPKRLGVAVGSESGMISVFEPTDEKVALIRTAPSISFALYECRSASSLPDTFDSPHVFRGAEYFTEGAE